MMRKSFDITQVASVLIFIVVGLLPLVLSSPLAVAATVVSGNITESVRWVPEKGPYIVSGDIVVGQRATLTIAAGTEVRFRRFPSSHPYTNRGIMKVLGTLKIEGTKDQRVYFGLSEDGAIGDWGGIWVDGYYGGRVIMEYAEIEKATRGIYVSGGSPVIKQSRFSSNFTGIHLEQTTDFILEGNVASGNGYGLYLDTSQGTLQKNSLISNSWGIYSFLSKGMAITHNAIKSNTFGIANDGSMRDVIEYNDFSIRQPNDYAVYLVKGKPLRINYNNFFYDPEIVANPKQVFWYIWNEDNAGDVNASHNWWDTTNPQIIEAYVMDRRDRSYLGLVNYLPLAQSPISGTADDISAPVISINALAPFSPVPDEDGEVKSLYVTYTLSETASHLTAGIRDINGLMGSKGEILWYKEWRAEDPLLRDGQHSWTWNGRLANGKVLVDGIYQVEMVAMDKEIRDLASETARTRLIIDSIPPTLEVTFPPNDHRLHSNSLTVKGTIEDLNLVGSSVLVREKSLGVNVRASLDGTSWEAFISRLREGLNILTVIAWDGAGNETEKEVSVIYEPVMDLYLTTPTNQDTQVIQGTIRAGFLDDISRIDVVVGGQHYATRLIDREFATQEAVRLSIGDNRVIAVAYDPMGNPLGEVMAVIEYDPLYDITIVGTFAPGLQMVSVPMTPFNDDPSATFESPLARWGYIEGVGPGYIYDKEQLPRLNPYRGYWWNPPSPQPIPVNGKAYDPAKGFRFPLELGWNQIGCPFLYPIWWDKVQFAADKARPLSWQEAVKEGWISRGLWTYGDGGYVPSATLEPWSGYWILARRQLEVVIPPEAVDLTGGIPFTKVTGEGLGKGFGSKLQAQRNAMLAKGNGGTNAMGLDATSWSMQLSLVAGELQDRYNYLGVAPGAKRGFDPEYQVEKPPPAKGPMLWLSSAPSNLGVKNREAQNPTGLGGTYTRGVFQAEGSAKSLPTGGQEGLRLAVDYRRPDEPLVWDVFIDNNSDTEEILLTWTGNWDPAKWQVILLDPATSTSLPLLTFGTRSLDLAADEIKHLQIQATSLGGELSLSEVLPYPNPWNMAQPLKLRFTITQPALVEARIYDVAGNLVRILPSERKTPGRHYFVWDGRNGRGRIAANGLYFYQVTARPVNGGKGVKAQGRLAILR